MNDLSKVLDEIILELDSLTNEQLQAKFEASKGGLVGAAIQDGESFLRHHLEEFSSNYNVSVTDVSQYYKAASSIHNDFISKLDEIVIEAINDKNYMMAA